MHTGYVHELLHNAYHCNAVISDSDEERVKQELQSDCMLSATVVNEILRVLHRTSAGRGLYEVPDSSFFLALQDGISDVS